MKNEMGTRPRICPFCGREYRERPALSRRDGRTQICPDCGTREALDRLGISASEQEKILNTIHRHTRNESV